MNCIVSPISPRCYRQCHLVAKLTAASNTLYQQDLDLLFVYGITELKNAAFDAMAYRTSRTLCGGNGVEPYAKMESIFFVRFLLI